MADLETFNTDSCQGRKWSWDNRECSRELSVTESLCFSSPFPVFARSLWHLVSGEGNNKGNTALLNHFPAYKWVYLNNPILKGHLMELLTPSWRYAVGKGRRDDKITLGSQNLYQSFTRNLTIWILYLKFGNGRLSGGRIRFSDTPNTAVAYFP